MPFIGVQLSKIIFSVMHNAHVIVLDSLCADNTMAVYFELIRFSCKKKSKKYDSNEGMK